MCFYFLVNLQLFICLSISLSLYASFPLFLFHSLHTGFLKPARRTAPNSRIWPRQLTTSCGSLCQWIQGGSSTEATSSKYWRTITKNTEAGQDRISSRRLTIPLPPLLTIRSQDWCRFSRSSMLKSRGLPLQPKQLPSNWLTKTTGPISRRSMPRGCQTRSSSQ